MLKNFYITTSIAYANAAPHIGYAMEICQADVLARYHRMKSDDVFFLSGTDENGSKIKKTALEKKVDPQKFVDENSAKFQLLLDTLNISNNDFIRTTDKKRHWPAAQKIWNELVKKGDIYKSSYEGYYCVGCEAYLTEKDLIDGKCSNHQKVPEKIKEENYFFKLSKYSKMIQEKIESGELEILPESRKNEILNVIKDGLKDISFSRPKKTLDWGVPVPNDETQTMYVWCDALTNYISALGYGNDYICHSREGGNPLLPQSANLANNFQKYWPADIHLIGKDILRFHAAIWPAMLISADLPLPKKIFVHGFITSNGQKISKSLGNIIDPFEVIDKYGVDALRYYLLKEIPSGGDGDFSFERFEEVYQADLANGIGNLVYRVLTMIERNFDNKIPESKKEALVPFEIIEKEMLEDAINKKEMKPLLDKQLQVVQKIDNKIKWYENRIKDIEIEKQRELSKMGDLLELSMTQTHSLSNGFTVKPDHKRKLEVKNMGEFLKWLKKTKEPQAVIRFLIKAIGVTALKSFCNKEANEQRINGELEPKIDGIEFGVISYRRLTTVRKEQKK